MWWIFSWIFASSSQFENISWYFCPLQLFLDITVLGCVLTKLSNLPITLLNLPIYVRLFRLMTQRCYYLRCPLRGTTTLTPPPFFRFVLRRVAANLSSGLMITCSYSRMWCSYDSADVCLFSSQVPTTGTGGQAEHAGAGAQEIHGAERWVLACSHAAPSLTQMLSNYRRFPFVVRTSVLWCCYILN